MGKEFYIKILKPVPDKFHQNRIFDEAEISDAGLTHTVYDGLSDKYHVKAKYRSVYPSMDDIRAYLKDKLPNGDFTTWGLRSIHGDGYHCYGNNWTYDIPGDVMDTLKRPHVMDTVLILSAASWPVTDWNGDWLAEKCPMYLTDDTMKEIFVGYMEHLKQEDKECLMYMLQNSDTFSENILNAACAAVAYAHQIGGVGFLEWE